MDIKVVDAFRILAVTSWKCISYSFKAQLLHGASGWLSKVVFIQCDIVLQSDKAILLHEAQPLITVIISQY